MGLLIGKNGLKLGRKKLKINSIQTSDLVQRLFKASSPIAQALGTEAIDYSPVPVNATVFQSCFIGTGNGPTFKNQIIIDWTTDGIKAEFVTSLAVGQTNSTVVYGYTNNHGFRVYDTQLRLYGYQADGSAIADISFADIDTVADNSFSRYRVTKAGVNIIVEKTIPSDVDFTDSGKVTQTKDVSAYNLGNQTFKAITPNGRLAFLNVNGEKFSFGEGTESRHIFSFTSSNYMVISPNSSLASVQNEYCHNAIYGYTRAYVKYSTNNEEANIPYKEDGTPATTLHSALLTEAVFEEFPADKSFGSGYGIQLNGSMLSYDHDNTFFDESEDPKLVYKKDIPTKLNSRIFFDHKNNNELLIYSADKALTRPVNTAAKSCLLIGDSIFTGGYFWDDILVRLAGFVKTNAGYSGQRLAVDVLPLLQAAVSVTPTLISDKEFIFIGGVFNDYGQDNISETTYLSGVTALFNYVRSQNATAKIFMCGMYNGGNPFDDGYTPSDAGLTYAGARAIIEQISDNDSNSHYIDWNTSGIMQSEVDSNGIHPLGPNGGYRIAKLIYDYILTIYQ